MTKSLGKSGGAENSTVTMSAAPDAKKFEQKEQPKLTTSTSRAAELAAPGQSKPPKDTGAKPKKLEPKCPFQCNVDLEAKMEIVKQDGRCQGCLRKGHISLEYKDERVC